jgi:hypothetical protein
VTQSFYKWELLQALRYARFEPLSRVIGDPPRRSGLANVNADKPGYPSVRLAGGIDHPVARCHLANCKGGLVHSSLRQPVGGSVQLSVRPHGDHFGLRLSDQIAIEIGQGVKNAQRPQAEYCLVALVWSPSPHNTPVQISMHGVCQGSIKLRLV